MTHHALIVVGSGPAGFSAAQSYRRSGGLGSILIVTNDDRLPYDRPPLSKDYLRGEIEQSDLYLESASFYPQHGISVLLSTTVMKVDSSQNVLSLNDGTQITFGACVISTGGSPLSPPIPGADHGDVLRLRSAGSAVILRTASVAARTALVVGSGFIGCEVAASLAVRGIKVTMVSQEQHPQEDRLGLQPARQIERWLREVGVAVVGDAVVQSIDAGRRLRLKDDREFEADLVLLAVGNAPLAQLAEDDGLVVDGGRICVDESMRTSAPGVFAAGDVALAFNAAAGRQIAVEHWGDALRMGEIAGIVAAGGEASWSQVPGFWTQIGQHTLKYAAWGDGYDQTEVIVGADGNFTVWYGAGGVLVGVLTHNSDSDYERGSALIEHRAAFDEQLRL